jgi:hypothetical protein
LFESTPFFFAELAPHPMMHVSVWVNRRANRATAPFVGNLKSDLEFLEGGHRCAGIRYFCG